MCWKVGENNGRSAPDWGSRSENVCVGGGAHAHSVDCADRWGMWVENVGEERPSVESIVGECEWIVWVESMCEQCV